MNNCSDSTARTPLTLYICIAMLSSGGWEDSDTGQARRSVIVWWGCDGSWIWTCSLQQLFKSVWEIMSLLALTKPCNIIADKRYIWESRQRGGEGMGWRAHSTWHADQTTRWSQTMWGKVLVRITRPTYLSPSFLMLRFEYKHDSLLQHSAL